MRSALGQPCCRGGARKRFQKKGHTPSDDGSLRIDLTYVRSVGCREASLDVWFIEDHEGIRSRLSAPRLP